MRVRQQLALTTKVGVRRYDVDMDFTSPAAWAFWILTTVAAYVGAYAAAKGKQRAAKEDSDQIRLELARNTQAVKEVEARVNSGLWEQQWRLNQKRDVYARLIEGMGELQMTIGAHARLTTTKDPDNADDVSQLYERNKTLLLELERSRAVARIFLSPGAVEAIDEFEKELKKAPNKLEYGEVGEAFSRATERLISAAKDELTLR
jgi:hypothetical protein